MKLQTKKLQPKKAVVAIPVKKKKITQFRPRIRSRHPSHKVLRNGLPLMPFRSVVRLGSTTPSDVLVECNSIQSVKNSASKLLMKKCFFQGGVTTAPTWQYNAGTKKFVAMHNQTSVNAEEMPFPLIVKSFHGSRGKGNSYIKTLEELQAFVKQHDMAGYIIELYRNYNREYRLHITEEGCFYTCRKMLKKDTPEHLKFQRHDDNCVWIIEENPAFEKPVNWKDIVADCVKALKSLGLDIGAFDLKVQSAKDQENKMRPNPEWIVIESCSAPSFGEITSQKYIQQIPKVLLKKNQKIK